MPRACVCVYALSVRSTLACPMSSAVTLVGAGGQVLDVEMVTGWLQYLTCELTTGLARVKECEVVRVRCRR